MYLLLLFVHSSLASKTRKQGKNVLHSWLMKACLSICSISQWKHWPNYLRDECDHHPPLLSVLSFNFSVYFNETLWLLNIKHIYYSNMNIFLKERIFFETIFTDYCKSNIYLTKSINYSIHWLNTQWVPDSVMDTINTSTTVSAFMEIIVSHEVRHCKNAKQRCGKMHSSWSNLRWGETVKGTSEWAWEWMSMYVSSPRHFLPFTLVAPLTIRKVKMGGEHLQIRQSSREILPNGITCIFGQSASETLSIWDFLFLLGSWWKGDLTFHYRKH